MIKLTPEHLKRIKLPEDYWYCQLSKIRDDLPYKQVVINYVDKLEYNIKEGRGLFLYGPYGHGKSGCLSIILKAAASQKHIGLFIKGCDIPSYLIEKIQFDEYYSMVDRMLDVPILGIDELLIYGDNRDFFTERLLRDRIDRKKPIIITSNFNSGQLKKTVPPIYSVLKEAITYHEISGQDFRQEIAEQNLITSR